MPTGSGAGSSAGTGVRYSASASSPAAAVPMSKWSPTFHVPSTSPGQTARVVAGTTSGSGPSTGSRTAVADPGARVPIPR